MSADTRGMLVLPLMILAAGLIGYGMLVPAVAAGVALGLCLGGGAK